MELSRAARVILIGAPGVGKGTQTERLLQRFPQLSAISTGDLLRSNVKRRTPLGIQAEGIIKSGGLVADDMMLRLLTDELRSRGWLSSDPHSRSHSHPHSLPPHHHHHHSSPSCSSLRSSSSSSSTTRSFSSSPNLSSTVQTSNFSSGAASSTSATLSSGPSSSFILDGYPRTATQASALDSIIPINLAVSLKTPDSVILERIAGRWVHEPSGRVYNTSFNAPRVPGVDDVTGEPLVQRADDSLDVYAARLDKFRQTSLPILEHYDRKGVLLEVDGLSSDDISPKLFAAFEKRFC
ncbi:adenylate kinase [Geosmithia morbida]|uniref:GTP:AMP phosphotransferase, mitochondrial n=1 Tax=Geosmithia morbida TaxID=1094350 RepID=A0A9P4YXS1_9HYPO|nr:adenylate kinase [Geosmithia morbida]KAF4124815.1 adenylate kinase [Geosmithia morbida]